MTTMPVNARRSHTRTYPPIRSARSSGIFLRPVPETFCECVCHAKYTRDAWLALPLLGRIEVLEDEDDDEEGDHEAGTIELRTCPNCRSRLAARLRLADFARVSFG